MPTTKTETLMVRLHPTLKVALKAAAEKDHRTVSNLIEHLIALHCQTAGVPIGKPAKGRKAAKQTD